MRPWDRHPEASPKAANLRTVQPIGSHRARITKRIDEQLICVDDKAPVVMAVFAQQRIDPIDAESGPLIAAACIPDRDVLMLDK